MKKKHFIRKRRKPKKRRPRNWPLSVAWMEPGVLAQFRSKLVPEDEDHWIFDSGIETWESPTYFMFRYTKLNWRKDAFGTQSPPSRIRCRFRIYNELCMVVDKRRLSDNVVLVQVIHSNRTFWVLPRELCKPERPNNDLETVS